MLVLWMGCLPCAHVARMLCSNRREGGREGGGEGGRGEGGRELEGVAVGVGVGAKHVMRCANRLPRNRLCGCCRGCHKDAHPFFFNYGMHSLMVENHQILRYFSW